MRISDFSFFPLVEGTKIPEKDFEWTQYQTRKPTEEEKKSWLKKKTFAIVTGKISGIFVVDIDSLEAAEEIKKLKLPKTFTVKTKKGWHLYFKYPENKIIKNRTKSNITEVDIRGEGGYVVTWNSVVDGFTYFILRDEPVAEFPKECYNIVEKVLPISTKTYKYWWDEVLNGVQNGNRNGTCAKLAGYLFHKNIPIDMVKQMLLDWNCKNNPPLNEKEIFRTIESIKNYHKNDDVTTLETTIQEEKTETSIFLEPKIIVKGGIHLIAGTRGVGKTFFATQLAASLVGKDKFLDLTVNNCSVLLIQKEIPYEVFKSERLDGLVGIRNKSNLLIHKNPYAVQITKGFADLVERSNCDVFILDPLKLFWGYTLEEQKKSIDILFDLCNNKGKTGIIVHHYRKLGANERQETSLDSVAGLGDWVDLATTVITLAELYDTQEFGIYMEFKKVRYCDKYNSKLLPKYLKFNPETLEFDITATTLKNKAMSIILSSYPGGVKQGEIIDYTGASPSMVSKTLSYLLREGKIIKKGKSFLIKEGE